MGLLDRIEIKTMGFYLEVLNETSSFPVERSITFCGNSITKACRRMHHCVKVTLDPEQEKSLFFYRCAGHLWVNTGDGITQHIGPWSTDVHLEAALISALLSRI